MSFEDLLALGDREILMRNQHPKNVTDPVNNVDAIPIGMESFNERQLTWYMVEKIPIGW